MRIALVGAQGTGKSTLGPLLAHKLGYAFIPECAREVLVRYKVNDWMDYSVETSIKIQREIMEMKAEYAAGKENVVADRCQADALAYSLIRLGLEPEAQDFICEMDKMVAEDAPTWDLVIVVPPNIPLINDGVRSPIQGYQNHVHHLIKGILVNYQYKWVELTKAPLDERIKEALDHIGKSSFGERLASHRFLHRS